MFNVYLKKTTVVELSRLYGVSLDLSVIPKVVQDEIEYYPILPILIALGKTSDLVNRDILDTLFHRQVQPEECKGVEVSELSKTKLHQLLQGTLYVVDSVVSPPTLNPVGSRATIVSNNPLQRSSSRLSAIDARPFLYYLTKVKDYHLTDGEANEILRKLFVSNNIKHNREEWAELSPEGFEARFSEVLSVSAPSHEEWTYRNVAISEPLNNDFNIINFAYDKADVAGTSPLIGGYCEENDEWVPLFQRAFLDRVLRKIVDQYIADQEMLKDIESHGLVASKDRIRSIPLGPSGKHSGLWLGDNVVDEVTTKLREILGLHKLVFHLTAGNSTGGQIYIKVVDVDRDVTLLQETVYPMCLITFGLLLSDFLIRNPNTYFNLDDSPFSALVRQRLVTAHEDGALHVNKRLGFNVIDHKREISTIDLNNVLLPTYAVKDRGTCCVINGEREIFYMEPGTAQSTQFIAEKVISFNVRYCNQIQFHSDAPDLTIPVVMLNATLKRNKKGPSGAQSTLYLTVNEIFNFPVPTEKFLPKLLKSRQVTDFFTLLFTDDYINRLPGIIATDAYVAELPA